MISAPCAKSSLSRGPGVKSGTPLVAPCSFSLLIGVSVWLAACLSVGTVFVCLSVCECLCGVCLSVSLSAVCVFYVIYVGER